MTLALLDFLLGVVGRVVDALGDGLDVLLDLGDQVLDVAGALLRGFGQGAHFVGDHREAFAMLAGARRLDGGIQRQQVGLVGDAGDRLDHFGNGGGLPLQFLDHADGGELTLGGAPDRQDGVGDLSGDTDDHGLQRFGLGDRGVGVLLGPDDQPGAMGDGLHGLLGGARRLFRSGGDLFGCLAQFFGRGSRLGDAAGKLRRGGRDALGRLLLPCEGAGLALLRFRQQLASGTGILGGGGRTGGLGGRLPRNLMCLHESHDIPRFRFLDKGWGQREEAGGRAGS